MNKRDLVTEISTRRKATRDSTAEIVDGFIDAVSKALSEGREVHLRRFGTFTLRSRRPRLMKNPRTGNEISVPAKLVPVFRSSKKLEFTINRTEEVE